MQGVLVRGIGGFYYAVDETGAEYTLRAQAKFRRQHLKPKIGDMVNFEPGNGEEEGWITEILPRKNELVRPPVANIDVICVVAAAAVPAADRMLVDRLLINARRAGIRPMLIVTKADLDKANAEAIAAEYIGAEVEPHIVSVETGEGVDELREALKGLTHAFAGQSGAGKSSLINALYGLSMETGDLSRKIDRGKNTTRRCELVTVPGGGRVLDTPGFSLLETETFDPLELKESYPEFTPYEGQCFFQPCYHASEPRCAARDAVATGEINGERHKRYCELLEELKESWRNRYD